MARKLLEVEPTILRRAGCAAAELPWRECAQMCAVLACRRVPAVGQAAEGLLVHPVLGLPAPVPPIHITRHRQGFGPLRCKLPTFHTSVGLVNKP